MKETAVVTGASSGFGLLTALELAQQGFYVFAAMRNPEKGSELVRKAEAIGVSEQIEILQLDVTKEESIDNFKGLVQHMSRLDVLVNNAGYAGAGFVEEIPLSEYRTQFETNVFGLIAVTQACLPVMRANRKGKIINVSSISGKIGFPGLSPYVASKHALEGWSECLRLEMKPFGVEVSLVEPGSFKTNIWSTGKQITEKSLQVDSPYYSYMQKLDNELKRGESSYGDPTDVAKMIAEIARAKEPSLRYPIGKGVRTSLALKNVLSWKRWERIFLKKLT
ncbi:oxidoreductase [Mesobacillus harenae]|uniref:oxidoreductase n=1 Tax=Mesobacillus harenae TaxID=2213203 RepID=UPI0015804CC0|nr:oxidoreductase [Mesobacillus harenae]